MECSHARRVETVLLVHSQQIVPTTAQEALAASEFALVGAASVEQALSWLDDASPALIVIDAEGFEASPAAVVARLREHPADPAPPILVLATLEQLPDIGEVFAAGANDYAQKPVDWSLLVHRIRTISVARSANSSSLGALSRPRGDSPSSATGSGSPARHK